MPCLCVICAEETEAKRAKRKEAAPAPDDLDPLYQIKISSD